MLKIRDLLVRDLDNKIEGIVKVDQHDEKSVYDEITEYVATDRIQQQYRQILAAIAEGPRTSDENVGVWVSGFFGSGKSSFAKNLGYILSNRQVLGHRASELFKAQLTDQRVRDLIDYINKSIPTEVVMFDVSRDAAVRKGDEKITDIMYRVLLRELGYAEDYDIAELEIELEAEGHLEEFVTECERLFGTPWRIVRKGAQRLARASAILHKINPATYPSVDTWSRLMASRKADISVEQFVNRLFDLVARRRPHMAIAFIVDEVGQYVARSTGKLEDLRALMEGLGKESKNRIKSRRAVAPVWVIVTSQEKLDEVVASIDSHRVELSKLQDRFHYRVDLAPADIREVATKRVLAKKPDAIPVLREIYSRSSGLLSAACRLRGSSRRSDFSEDEFVQFYPYLPHFMDLSIDIVSGIRLQPGAPKHLGGSNRTIIKQAYEMLVSDRTRMAERPVGSLVSLDLVFELVEGNLSTERQKDISDIAERYQNDPSDKGWAVRVAKAICLLEFVRDLPRTEENIAALLLDEVGKPAPLDEVKGALERLLSAKFVRLTDEGYKIQTAQEKNWETERQGYLSPKPQERNEIKREILTSILSDSALKVHRFRNLRSFRLALSVDGNQQDDGQIPLTIMTAEGPEEYKKKVEQVRDQSRESSHRNDVYWVVPLDNEVLTLISELHASRQMILKYDEIRGKRQISPIELDCLAAEKTRESRCKGKIKDVIQNALVSGMGVFRGVARDGSALGKTAHEALKKWLDIVVPDLYPKLEMGAVPLRGTEAEEVLKAANLGTLSQVFYGGDSGLNLITKDGPRFVPNLSSGVATEIMNYLVKENSYGSKVTGKDLEDYFCGFGYGWERDMIRTVLAVLLRAGALEVTYQDRRYTSHQDPLSRLPFTNNNVFRAASFAPHATLDLPTLAKAAKAYGKLTGKEVNVEVEAIAQACRLIANEEWVELERMKAVADANRIPIDPAVRDFGSVLDTWLKKDPDECVRVLAERGDAVCDARDRFRRLKAVMDGDGLEAIRQARRCLRELWPHMTARAEYAHLKERMARLAQILDSAELVDRMNQIKETTRVVVESFRELYEQAHVRHQEELQRAVIELESIAERAGINRSVLDHVMGPLSNKICPGFEFSYQTASCRHCSASLGEIEGTLAALNDLKTSAAARIQELARPNRPTRRVKISGLLPPTISDAQEIEAVLQRLREYLSKIIATGTTIIVE